MDNYVHLVQWIIYEGLSHEGGIGFDCLTWFLRSVTTAASPPAAALGVCTLLTGSLPPSPSSLLDAAAAVAAGSISPLQLLLAPIRSLASRR